MTAFLLWSLFGAAFIILGIYDLRSKKASAFGFWANADVFPVKDVSAYNKALGKLWIVFGIVFILLGTPFLFMKHNALSLILPLLGSMGEAIAAMAVYTTVIEKKYRS